jgi:hypothetical protein
VGRESGRAVSAVKLAVETRKSHARMMDSDTERVNDGAAERDLQVYIFQVLCCS